ncbi:hypothetical protein B0H14DRAFT_1227687 [Mycena olivaceomarginata]|nr:hypothetical protein B0H14DRAFT_1227687 [Mycena olivaceomarginata]
MPSPASEPLLAAHFVGVVLAMIFYGITLGQAYAYYRTYMTDPRHMRIIVALLLFLDTFQVFLAFTSIYDYTIRLRGDESALQYVSRPFSASMAVTSVVAFTVQMIYAYRVWRLSAGNAHLTTSIVSLAFIALGSGIAMTVKTIRNPRWDETRVSNLAAGIILASTVTCDLLIASAQVWLFHRHRLKGGKLFSFALGRRREPIASPPLSPVAATEEGTRSSTAEPPTPRGGSRRGSLLTGITSLAGSWRVGSGPASTVATAEAGKEEQQGCVNGGDQDGCRNQQPWRPPHDVNGSGGQCRAADESGCDSLPRPVPRLSQQWDVSRSLHSPQQLLRELVPEHPQLAPHPARPRRKPRALPPHVRFRARHRHGLTRASACCERNVPEFQVVVCIDIAVRLCIQSCTMLPSRGGSAAGMRWRGMGMESGSGVYHYTCNVTN